MRAIVCHEFDSPGKLELTEVADPEPAAGEVVIAVKAAGLGYVDALTVAGLYQIKPSLPFIPGTEISGVVETLGAGVDNLEVGQRVIAMPTYGGLAEKVVTRASQCLAIPDNLDHAAAAGFQVNYCTALHGLDYCGQVKPGERVLVLGASGGVGVAAIDVARFLGAEVIAGASTAEKRAACTRLGASATLDYTRDGWRDDLKNLLDGHALDVVYDPVGGPYAEQALRSLSPGGRFLVVGFAAGEIPKLPLNLPLLKRISVVGVNWGGHAAANPGASAGVMSRLLEGIRDGKLHPQAGETFDLANSGQAMLNMLERKAIGKVVITTGNQP